MSVNFNISRRTKILACVAAALAIVCAAQFLLGLRSPQKNFKLKGEPDYISIENSGATLVLQKSESGWISGTEALDSNKVNLLIKSLSPLATLGVTSRSASEATLERYGLDKPIKVCLKAKDKNLLSLSIGKNGSSGSQSYVQVNGKGEIYLARRNLRSDWDVKIDSLKPEQKAEAEPQDDGSASGQESGEAEKAI